MPAKLLASAQSKLRLAAIYGSRLLARVPPEVHMDLGVEIDLLYGPEEAAVDMRRALGVPPGPAPNIIDLIEHAGGIVAMCDLHTNKIDALSTWAPDGRPTFLINSRAPVDRIRFSLVHELGHVAFHKTPSKTAEEEADRFASEFLLPEQNIRIELKELSIERLAILKEQWRTSMAAILRRARDLGAIAETQYIDLVIQMNQSGLRTHEPVDLEPEYPSKVSCAIDHLLETGTDWSTIEMQSLARRTELEDLFYVS